MLSRASSDAGTRLRRSKSTSTVHSHRTPALEPLDPDIAQHHAIAAATAAFIRAHAADAVANTKNRSVELARSKSNASHGSQGSQLLQRETSLRSSMRPQKAAAPGISRKPRASTGLEKFPPFHITPSAARPMSAQPSISSNENMRPSSQPKAQRPGASSSMASQQIRKARSMYYASSIQTGSPIPRPPAKYLTTPPPVSPLPNSSHLTARSADGSLLSARSADGFSERPRSSVVSPLAPARPPVVVEPNEAVDKARDKCLQDFQQHRQVKHKPSLFLAPFKKRQEKLKKKAPPSSSGGGSVTSHTTVDPGFNSTNDHKPLKEKRSISDSLRNKFKKVFRKSSNKTTLPVQKVNAKRNYYTEQGGDMRRHSDLPTRLDIPSPDEFTLQRVRSRSPSFEGGHAALARPNSRGSSRSLHSEASVTNATTSRVTSWSNSSVGDTLTQRAIKRLTVIHEAKDSLGSEAEHQFPPASPRRKPPPLPGFAAFRDPMPMDTLLESTSTPVDPKRVFSALMKEIDASQNVHSANTQRTPGGDSDVFVSSATRELHSSASRDFRPSASSEQRPLSSQRPNSVPAQSKSASVKTSSFKTFGRALKATIRSVTPSEPPPSSSPVPDRDRVTSVRGAVRIPRPTSAGSSISTISEGADNHGEENTLKSVNFKLRPRAHTPRDVVTPTQDHVEGRTRNEHSRWNRHLVRDKVSCMPEAADIAAPANTTPDPPESGKQFHGISRNPLRSPKPRQVFSPLSPSIYSRNTDGASIFPNDSVMSLDATTGDLDEHGPVSGSAVIITSQSVKSYVIGTPTPQRVTASARSSRDWKAWLSHEVSELGNLSGEDISIQYSTPTAHRREFTQISDEEDTVLHELEGSSPPEIPSEVIETSTYEELEAEPSTVDKSPPESLAPPKPSVECPTARKVSPHRQPSPNAAEPHHSSISSAQSSISRPKLKQSMSSGSGRMNDRFPFIVTGRGSSNNSVKVSRHTPSLAGSQSSSSKATPSPRVYSDFSAPGSAPSSIKTSKTEPKKTMPSDCNKASRKENMTPSATPKALGFPKSPSSQSLDRPKSLNPLAPSSWNRATSSLAQYTTSADDLKGNQNPKGPPSPRIRLRMRPITPGKLTMRPKSAFDLRNMNKPSLASSTRYNAGGNSPRKSDLYQSSVPSKPERGQTFDSDALRMMLESPWTAKGNRSTPNDSRRLHAAKSSSTLALNKEPSPGTETRIIDSVLGDGESEDYRGSSRGGSVTPGHRMADRFLRERNGGSGAGSPIPPSTEEESSGAATPAFL